MLLKDFKSALLEMVVIFLHEQKLALLSNADEFVLNHVFISLSGTDDKVM